MAMADGSMDASPTETSILMMKETARNMDLASTMCRELKQRLLRGERDIYWYLVSAVFCTGYPTATSTAPAARQEALE